MYTNLISSPTPIFIGHTKNTAVVYKMFLASYVGLWKYFEDA